MNIIPVSKSGDLSITDNYRGINLTCIIAKMYKQNDTEPDKKIVGCETEEKPEWFPPQGTT